LQKNNNNDITYIMPKQPNILTKKEEAFQKKRVRLFVKKWINRLQLDVWNVTICPVNDYKDSPSGYHPQAVNGLWETVMSTSADPWYMQASITCYLPVIEQISDEILEETVIHEFMHVYLSPMSSSKFKKEEELVATSLARTFIRMNPVDKNVHNKNLYKES